MSSTTRSAGGGVSGMLTSGLESLAIRRGYPSVWSAQQAQAFERVLEGVEQLELGDVGCRHPTRLGGLPVQILGRREAMGHLDHVGPVRPTAVVVLVHVDHLEVMEVRADLLGELPHRRLQRRLTQVDGTARDGPRAAAVTELGAASEEVPRLAVVADVARQHPGGAVATPALAAVGDRDEAVTRYAHDAHATPAEPAICGVGDGCR